MDYDVIVIGGGPGGYVAAIRAAQLGFKTACIEKGLDKDGAPVLGGTCLNSGCIPSKALLDSSKLFETINLHSKEFGINVADARADIVAMIDRKDKIVKDLTGGIAELFKANNIDWLKGTATLNKDKQVRVMLYDGTDQVLVAENIILATGSEPILPLSMPLIDDYVVDSEACLNLMAVPEKLCIIGAGVIALEQGSVWNRLGSEVTLLDSHGFLTEVDFDIAKIAKSEFKKQGLNIITDVNVSSVEVIDNMVEVKYTKNSQSVDSKFDKVLLAVGRKANTENTLSKTIGIKVLENGQIEVDDNCQTAVAGVYAIGDIVRGPMLAHKASEEGVMVAEHIAGQKTNINYAAVPSIIYTEPELAWVGETEEKLKAKSVDYKVGTFRFIANGRAKAANSTVGLIKIIADAKTDRILAAHMCGSKVSELIAQIVIAIEFEGSAEDLSRTMFAHPTFSEVLHEAALAVDNRALHSLNK